MASESAVVLPRDNNDLFAQYASYVAKLLRKYDILSRQHQDLSQDVWMRLTAADVLGKFKKSLEKLPPTMTAEEAAAFCQVTWAQYINAVRRSTTGTKMANGRYRRITWMPKRIAGTPYSRKAFMGCKYC